MLLRANARAAPTVYARYVQHWMQQPYLLTRSQSTSAPTADHALLQRDAATKSPVTRVHFRGQCVHVKRDDVFHLAGNKMRKLHWFVAQDDAFYKDTHLFSFGGTQSNAMLAIAQLAHAKRVPFTYFSRGLGLQDTSAGQKAGSNSGARPLDTETLQQGNLALAMELRMQHIELSSELYQTLAQTKDFSALSQHLPDNNASKRAVYIPQGAAFEQAQQGLALLAQEINAYIASERLADPDKRFSVVVPCGTGTTALYMAQHLDPESTELYAVPCVGDTAYLEQQLSELVEKDTSLIVSQRNSTLRLPRILKPKRKSRFGRLWWPLYEIHHELLDATGIAFDLIYGSFAWHTMFDESTLALLLGEEDAQPSAMNSRHVDSSTTKRELMYVHTGGVSGNATMLARYQAKLKTQ